MSGKKQADPARVSQIINFLCGMPGGHTTDNLATAKAVLEHDTIFCNGLLRQIRTKHLGCGVYRIFTEELR